MENFESKLFLLQSRKFAIGNNKKKVSKVSFYGLSAAVANSSMVFLAKTFASKDKEKDVSLFHFLSPAQRNCWVLKFEGYGVEVIRTVGDRGRGVIKNRRNVLKDLMGI